MLSDPATTQARFSTADLLLQRARTVVFAKKPVRSWTVASFNLSVEQATARASFMDPLLGVEDSGRSHLARDLLLSRRPARGVKGSRPTRGAGPLTDEVANPGGGDPTARGAAKPGGGTPEREAEPADPGGGKPDKQPPARLG
eukprot:6467332-Amphidinium_carterae.1